MTKMALNAREVAQATGLSRAQIYILASAGQIPLVRVGRRILFPVRALEEWLALGVRGGEGAAGARG